MRKRCVQPNNNMMKTTFIFGTLTILFGLTSCERSNEDKPEDTVIHDTIKPLEYFPTYPGSYWIYDNNDTLIVTAQYEKYIYNSAGFDATPNIDTLVLPKLKLNGIYNPNDTFAYVKGYSISKAINSDYRDPAFKFILSEAESATFIIGGRWQYHQIIGKTIKVDTTITIDDVRYDSVLITIELDIACNEQGLYPIDSCAYKREYYAKGIGLIKRESGGYIPNENWTTDFELIKYKIEK
jgi:hypothetical protein